MLREWVGGQEYAYAEIYVHTREQKEQEMCVGEKNGHKS